MTAGTSHLRDVLERKHLVKIDGIREPRHAAAAAMAGADLIGFIFAPARRQVTPDTAAACIAAARASVSGRAFATVGVFVDASAAEIRSIVALSGVDLVQLHGDETPELLADVPVPAFKAFRPQPGIAGAALLSEIGRFDEAPKPPAGILIDGYDPSASGGTGTRADWDLAAEVAAKRPILVAGGLNPENVRDAIRVVLPWGVDVSSGVEVDGVKDAARIEAFIHAARAAFREQGGLRS